MLLNYEVVPLSPKSKSYNDTNTSSHYRWVHCVVWFAAYSPVSYLAFFLGGEWQKITYTITPAPFHYVYNNFIHPLAITLTFVEIIWITMKVVQFKYNILYDLHWCFYDYIKRHKHFITENVHFNRSILVVYISEHLTLLLSTEYYFW